MAPDVEIGFAADQGQARRDGFELSPGLDAARPEPGLEDAPHGRDEGGAAGQEDPVDGVVAKAAAGHGLQNMRKRAASMGGAYTCNSNDQGTALNLRVPFTPSTNM